MSSGLEIRLLGGVEFLQAGTPISNFMSNKAPALLAYLAVTKQSHQRDRLATLLWGEMIDADARNNLRQVLSNLRKLVDPSLLVSRDSLGFNCAAPYVCDVERFEQHLCASREAAATHQVEQQIAALQQAATLYRGDFLDGFFVRDAPEFEEWMLAQRAHLHELALHALHTLTELLLARGDYSHVIDSASHSLTIDPWREETHRQLMIALARNGQRSAALAQFRTCQRTLQHELGVEPSSETRSLYERIRAAGESIPHNLPPQPTLFVGRSHELEQIERSLLQDDCRLLTLVGVGGTGKTRLALQAAERLWQMGAFLNGVYFVSLAALDSPALLASALAEACGLTFSGNKSAQSQVIDYLCNQELLLLLDNFEQMIEAAGWLSEILRAAPRVKFLVTSRERLNTRWEQLCDVAGLDHGSAVALFMQRARLADPHFAPQDEAIRRICQLVQALPLGIELAAANVRHYSCAEIADSIIQSLDLLTVQFRDIPPRHRSVRAVFDSSWRLLAPGEQELLLLLSIFQGGFQPAAVQMIASTLGMAGSAGQTPHAPVSRRLNSLADKSLLQRRQDGRLQLHELIRQYAAEKLALEPVWATQVRRTHAQFYASWLAKQASVILGRQQSTLLVEIEQDIDNVRTAWSWAVAEHAEPVLAEMVDTLFEFYEVRSLVQEAGERFGQALAMMQQYAPQDQKAAHTLVKLLNRQARFLMRLARRSEAAELLQQCLRLALPLQASGELALAYNYLGLNQQTNGNYSEAVRLFVDSEALCRAICDRVGRARALNNLGVIHIRMGDFPAAERYLQDALALRRQLENPKLIADSLNNLGILLHELGDYDREVQLLHEALEQYRELNDRKGMGVILHNLGGVHLALKQYTEARRFLEEAWQMRHNDPIGLGNTLNNMGTVALRAGDLRAAGEHYSKALRTAHDSQEAPMIYDILVGMAELLLLNQKSAVALELLAFVLPKAQDRDTLNEARRIIELVRQTVPANAAPAETIGAPRTVDELIALALHEVA